MVALIIAIVILLVGVILISQAKGQDEKNKGTFKLAGYSCVFW